jgi:hypothetical protein
MFSTDFLESKFFALQPDIEEQKPELLQTEFQESAAPPPKRVTVNA